MLSYYTQKRENYTEYREDGRTVLFFSIAAGVIGAIGGGFMTYDRWLDGDYAVGELHYIGVALNVLMLIPIIMAVSGKKALSKKETPVEDED